MRTASSSTNPWKVILIAGLLAGTLDILAACTKFYIDTGRNPDIVLKYIASAVFGRKDAYAGGIVMSAWGLFFHYLISFGLAAFFVFLYRRWPLVSKNIVVSGLLYGIFAWIITTKVIVPLSKLGWQPFNIEKAVIPILILMFMIGLPIALVTKKFYPRPAGT